MEEYLTPLMPVSEWPWALYQIVFSENETDPLGRTLELYVISTDTHLDSTVQERWPSSQFNWYQSELVDYCAEPQRVPSRYGVQHVDCWRAGEELVKRLKLELTSPL